MPMLGDHYFSIKINLQFFCWITKQQLCFTSFMLVPQ